MSPDKAPRDWKYPGNPSIFSKPGRFTAWIKATKFPAPYSVSAFAFLIKHSDDCDAPHEEHKASAGSESTEQQAYVAAAYRVVEALPPNSSVLIHCREINIVEAINGRVDE
jgi:hypothetical protein